MFSAGNFFERPFWLRHICSLALPPLKYKHIVKAYLSSADSLQSLMSPFCQCLSFKMLYPSLLPVYLFVYLFLKILFIYSWETYRDAETQAEEKQAPRREPDVELDPTTGIIPWAKGRCPTAEPPRCPSIASLKATVVSFWNLATVCLYLDVAIKWVKNPKQCLLWLFLCSYSIQCFKGVPIQSIFHKECNTMSSW